MRKYVSLTRVLLKTALGGLDIKLGGKERKWAAPVLWGVVALGMLPLLSVFYGIFRDLFGLFAPAGQLGYGVGLLLNITSSVIFVFSFLSAPGIFYMSKDIDYLLPLPLMPRQIVAAKFTVALLFEYAMALIVMGPMTAALLAHVPAAALTFNALVVFLALPVVPLAYSTAIIMLLMRFSGLGRNKDAYTLVIGVVGLAVGLWIGVYSQRLTYLNPEQIQFTLEGNAVTLNALRSVFFTNNFAAEALAGGTAGGLRLLLFIGLTALVMAVFLFIGERLYLKGAVGLSEAASPRKKMRREDIARQTRGQSVFRAYLLKEYRLLLRSPVALLNCVLLIYLMPFMMGTGIFASLQNSETANLSDLLAQMRFISPAAVKWGMVGAAALGFLFSSMCMVTVTAISREGPAYFVMKYLPVPYRVQLNAKAVSGLLLTALAFVVLLGALQAFVRLPAALFAGAVCLTLPGAVFMSYMGLYLDLLKPKLTWDSEQHALKNNLNTLFQMFVGMLAAGVLVALGALLTRFPAPVVFAALFAAAGLAAAGCARFVLNAGEEIMEKL